MYANTPRVMHLWCFIIRCSLLQTVNSNVTVDSSTIPLVQSPSIKSSLLYVCVPYGWLTITWLCNGTARYITVRV